MAQNTRISPAKSISDLSRAARNLLESFEGPSQTVLRLNGAPFELIGLGLATFAFSDRGYVLDLTEAGMNLLRPMGNATTSPSRDIFSARSPKASYDFSNRTAE
jgi:hypothetical protein